jgi:hypothetical protein
MNSLINRCNRRAHLAEEIVEEAWLLDHRDVMLGHVFEDAVGECLDLNKLVRHVWVVALEMLFREEIHDIGGTKRALVVTVDRAISTMKRALDLVQGATAKYCSPAKVAELSAAVQSSENIRLEIDKKWPTANPQMVAESMAAYHRGECRPIEDWLSETQSNGAAVS